MPQSNVIFFYVFAAFFVYITLRGELPKYMGFLLASPTGGSTNLGVGVSGNSRTDSLGQVSGMNLPMTTSDPNGPNAKNIGTAINTAAMIFG
jgi:hypothetical protein